MLRMLAWTLPGATRADLPMSAGGGDGDGVQLVVGPQSVFTPHPPLLLLLLLLLVVVMRAAAAAADWTGLSIKQRDIGRSALPAGACRRSAALPAPALALLMTNFARASPGAVKTARCVLVAAAVAALVSSAPAVEPTAVASCALHDTVCDIAVCTAIGHSSAPLDAPAGMLSATAARPATAAFLGNEPTFSASAFLQQTHHQLYYHIQ